MECKVFYHDKCFDGACSASLFTRFYRERVGAAQFSYEGLVHRAGNLFDPAAFTGDENAVVDFKYFRSPKVTWWFDHHLSAFASPDDEAEFRREEASTPQRKFFDASYISCTKLIADVAVAQFGFDARPLAELIHWANIVDGAKFESAEAAVGMHEPAMVLTLILESSTDHRVGQQMIPLLTGMPLAEVLAQPFLQRAAGPLLERHRAAIGLIGERARVDGGVVTFDLMDQAMEGYNKFIPYYLHPEATYVVGLSRSSFRTKISVGTNPWTSLPPDQLINLAAICEQYGGGGHARVGAISFPVGAEEEARTAAGVIAAGLRR